MKCAIAQQFHFFWKKKKIFFVQKKIVKDCSEEYRWRDNRNITQCVHNNRHNHNQHKRRRISFSFRQTSFSPCEEQMPPENKQIIPILIVLALWRRWFLTSPLPRRTFFRFAERPFWRENLLTKYFPFLLSLFSFSHNPISTTHFLSASHAHHQCDSFIWFWKAGDAFLQHERNHPITQCEMKERHQKRWDRSKGSE